MTRIERVTTATALGLLVSAIGLVSRAAADDDARRVSDDGLDLTFNAPAECPARDAFQKLVDRALDQVVLRDRIHVVVAIEPATRGRRGYHAAILLPAGERSVDGLKCDTLASAAATIVGLAVRREQGAPPSPSADPVTAVPPDVPVPAPTPKPTPPGPPQAARRPAPPVSTRRAREERGVFSAGFVVDYGSLEAAAPGAAFSLGIQKALWRVEMTSSFFHDQRIAASAVPTAGGVFSLWTFGPRLCRMSSTATLALEGCVGGELGRMTAQSYGVPITGSEHSPWLAASASLGVHVAASPRVAFLTAATLVAPLLRDRFTLLGIGDVHRAAAALPRAHIDAAYSF